MLWQNHKLSPRKSSGLRSKYKVMDKSGGW
jgi:hypothetical protein